MEKLFLREKYFTMLIQYLIILLLYSQSKSQDFNPSGQYGARLSYIWSSQVTLIYMLLFYYL